MVGRRCAACRAGCGLAFTGLVWAPCVLGVDRPPIVSAARFASDCLRDAAVHLSGCVDVVGLFIACCFARYVAGLLVGWPGGHEVAQGSGSGPGVAAGPDGVC